MIPVTYPSSLSYRTTRQMVAYPITDLTGKRRWTDYIPVKFVDQTTFTVENSHNNNAYISVDMLSSNANLKEGIDYIPVYIDNAATDAWQVSATGYIPVGYSGAALSLQFAGSTFLDSRITFTRASSGTYFDNTGVLRRANRNLLTYSEQFDNAAWVKSASSVTANSVVAPDGTITADFLVENTASAIHRVNNAATSFTSGTAYTLSIFAKSSNRNIVINARTAFNARANFNLADGTVNATSDGTAVITNVGNGWYRCSVTGTATATASVSTFFQINTNALAADETYTGDGTSGIFIWGAQLEAGSFATSYIPTVAAQVTRSADSAVMTGTNFSSWYSAGQGTLFVESARIAAPTNSSFPRVASVNDNTSNNEMAVLWATSLNRVYGVVVTGGVVQADVGYSGQTQTVLQKTALAYAINDFAFAANAQTVQTDTSGTIPAVNRLSIGNIANASEINGHIRKLVFYPARLSNTALQALTA